MKANDENIKQILLEKGYWGNENIIAVVDNASLFGNRFNSLTVINKNENGLILIPWGTEFALKNELLIDDINFIPESEIKSIKVKKGLLTYHKMSIELENGEGGKLHLFKFMRGVNCAKEGAQRLLELYSK